MVNVDKYHESIDGFDYKGNYIDFSVLHRDIAVDKGYISSREYEDEDYIVFIMEKGEHELNPKDSPKMLLSGGFSDEFTAMREIAFVLYNKLVSDHARLEMRDLFLTGHEYGKHFYLLNTIIAGDIMDSYFETLPKLEGELVLYSTAQQCLDFVDKSVYANGDENYSVNIINISRVNTGANIRKFIGSPCIIGMKI